jgi:hypothetical protein
MMLSDGCSTCASRHSHDALHGGGEAEDLRRVTRKQWQQQELKKHCRVVQHVCEQTPLLRFGVECMPVHIQFLHQNKVGLPCNRV